ncbi:MAG: DUF1320 domain-containing protein [Balneola sp.]
MKSLFRFYLMVFFAFLAFNTSGYNVTPISQEYQLEQSILPFSVDPVSTSQDGVLIVQNDYEHNLELEYLMPYSTDTDLYDRIDPALVIQLTDDAGDGVVNQTKLDALRADCHELINTHLRGRYTVPLNPAPEILTIIEADLLVYKVYSRRGDYEIPESVVKADQKAMAMLKDINRGTIKLEDQPDVGEASIVTNKKKSDRIFSDDNLESF